MRGIQWRIWWQLFIKDKNPSVLRWTHPLWDFFTTALVHMNTHTHTHIWTQMLEHTHIRTFPLQLERSSEQTLRSHFPLSPFSLFHALFLLSQLSFSLSHSLAHICALVSQFVSQSQGGFKRMRTSVKQLNKCLDPQKEFHVRGYCISLLHTHTHARTHTHTHARTNAFSHTQIFSRTCTLKYSRTFVPHSYISHTLCLFLLSICLMIILCITWPTKIKRGTKSHIDIFIHLSDH